jgi:hypothetical protein
MHREKNVKTTVRMLGWKLGSGHVLVRDKFGD